MKRIFPKISEKPEIEKSLVVSTAHISEQDKDHLETEAETNTAPTLVVYKYEYGYIIFVGSSIEEIIDDGLTETYSLALCNLIKLAKDNGCTYLKLDCDGIIYEDLKTFDW